MNKRSKLAPSTLHLGRGRGYYSPPSRRLPYGVNRLKWRLSDLRGDLGPEGLRHVVAFRGHLRRRTWASVLAYKLRLYSNYTRIGPAQF